MFKQIIKQIWKQSALLASQAEQIAIEVHDPNSPALLGKVGNSEACDKTEIDDDVARFLQNH